MCKILGFEGFYISGERTDPTTCGTNSPFVSKLNDTETEPMTYTNWYPGEPNCNVGSLENCVHMWKKFDYQWNDIPCQDTMCSVCEFNK